MNVHRVLVLGAVLGGLGWLVGCGDSTTDPVPPPPPPPPSDPPRATTVTVSPTTAELTALDATVQFAADVRDQNGQVMAGAAVTWTSGSPGVATVNASGLATAVSNGTATITATAGSASGSAAVTVAQMAGSVTVSPAEAELAPGDTLRLAAEVLDANGHPVQDAEFSWASSDEAVARVDASGLVTAIAAGAATMTASSGAVSATAEITVGDADRAVLVTLYEATDGAGWLENRGWLSDRPIGEWHGVTTGPDGRVTAAAALGEQPGGVDPTGTRPPGTRLETLELERNKLAGPIPPELGRLASLKTLILGVNDLTGGIPPELGALGRPRGPSAAPERPHRTRTGRAEPPAQPQEAGAREEPALRVDPAGVPGA